ncbi:ImmA/IrrE family metallo-endopeptidase [Weissella muntiaci]|uniref:ImmA/IrrE family metallo-endopeptidase n=1 Tax=Weissella muntiaci TaxID=2508881 RepID=A0A6C2CBW4_9LACO|nr:ImmA/IrrE family metallo-endopeptidase [Weissella muntiaci]TYC50853.1 ImmA/IrrE family metallo-endopeptidase [Weissella muntiaci]
MNLSYFQQEMYSQLSTIASRNGIEIIVVDRKDDEPDLAIAGDNIIFLNKNYVTSFSIVFRLAHELAHLLYGDLEDQKAYAFSPLSEKYEERRAHYGASKIIASIMYFDVPMYSRNYINFMGEFGLPSAFEDIVHEAIESV